MTGYIDYLLLLSPPEAIRNEISRYKKASVRLIGNFKSMDAPAHISVAHFERQKPYIAEQLIDRMESKLNIMPPVLLHIDGFKYFTHLHGKMTIYAHIRTTPAADAWFTLLKKNLHIKKALIPHITVVRDIPEAQFNLLWPHYRHKKLVEPFWVNALTICQRETFGGAPGWKAFKTFEFKNKLRSMENIPLNESLEIQNQIDLF